MANLRTKIPDLRGFESSRTSKCKLRNLRTRRDFPGSLESRNLSRGNLSGEIGRKRDGDTELTCPGIRVLSYIYYAIQTIRIYYTIL